VSRQGQTGYSYSVYVSKLSQPASLLTVCSFSYHNMISIRATLFSAQAHAQRAALKLDKEVSRIWQQACFLLFLLKGEICICRFGKALGTL